MARWSEVNLDPALIVGWAAWYSDGRRFTSLDTDPRNLPERDVQVFKVWHHDPDRRRKEDGTLRLYHKSFTGYDRYPIPGSDRVICGDWTSIINHNEITREANAFRWPE
jgi:hypothetical protein